MSEDKIHYSKPSKVEEFYNFESLFYGPCDCGKTLEDCLGLKETFLVKMSWDGKDIQRKLICCECYMTKMEKEKE